MKLIINTLTLFRGGSIQVAASFLEECKGIEGHEYHVFLGANLSKEINKSTFPGNFIFYDCPIRPASGIINYFRALLFFKSTERLISPDCVFTTSGPSYWRPKAPHLVGCNRSHLLYPESPYFNTLSFKDRILWLLRRKVLLSLFYSEGDAYVVQNEENNKRLRRLLKKDNIFTVSNTHSSIYSNPHFYKNKLPERSSGERRFLVLSVYYRHKNLDIIKNVVEELKSRGVENIRFILTIPEDIYEKRFGSIYKPEIINVGPVSVKECPSLYKECDFVFLPTLLESFSAVYPEAMIMEKPILTSDISFARSICSDAALYFNPLEPKDIADKIVFLIDDPLTQRDLIARGRARLGNFMNARQRAEKYLSICQSLVKRPV